MATSSRRLTRIGLPLLAAAALLLPSSAGADPARPHPAAGTLSIIALTDTTSVRIEARLTGASASAPVRVDAVIRPAGSTEVLWAGPLGTTTTGADGSARVEHSVGGLHPDWWSPSTPRLYTVIVRAGDQVDSVRVGFRRFEMRDGRLFLNGRPIFLRGNAINPPGRTIPDSLDENPRFVRDYVQYMKSIGVNMIRLSEMSQVWLDVCDEQGMMLFQGLYGAPRGGSARKPPAKPFEQVVRDYHQVLDPLANHPSVVVYVLSNELAGSDMVQVREGADTIAAFLKRVYTAMRSWDSTRVYIANAGYGYGKPGDICDTHHYWGWYYATVLSFYTLRDPHNCWRSGYPQPITVSENTGSYTGPDGAFNILPEKQLGSQLNWTGHAPPAEQPARALAYQAFVAQNAIEIMRRTRDQNPYLAGLMPFTTLFGRWWDIRSFADMAPKPVARQFGLSYQPVLLSWELWTPQVYAGTTLRPTAHVVNDDTLGRDLKAVRLEWRVLDPAGAVRDSGRQDVGDVAYFQATGRALAIALPGGLPQGTYTLDGRLLAGGQEVSRNTTTFFVAPLGYAGGAAALSRRVLVYDPAPGNPTAGALRRLGVPFRSVRSFAGLRPTRDALVVGANTWGQPLAAARPALRAFVRAGGRVLLLDQSADGFDATWSGASLRPLREQVDRPGDRTTGSPYRNAMAVNPERAGHPVLAGLDRDRLFLWSDPTGWTERSPGLPAVFPVTRGFVLANARDLEHTAVLADYGPALEGIALAEVFQGKGSTLVSGFGLVDHAGLDPAADRLLMNLIRYTAGAAGHEALPLVAEPIRWGDYASEAGVVLEGYSGLLVNTVPVVPAGLTAKYPVAIDSLGYQYAGGRGGWNTKPAIQYVARGRRPFGPFEQSLFSSPQLPKQHAPVGEGGISCRVPAGRSVMTTVVQNPAAAPLEIEITLNGVAQRQAVPAGQSVSIDTPLKGATALAIRFRGDRRLVLQETSFR